MKRSLLISTVLGISTTILLFIVFIFQVGPGSVVDAKPMKNEPAAAPTSMTMVFIDIDDSGQTIPAAGELADLVAEETGLEVHHFIAACPGAAVDMMRSETADFGWLPALTYVFAHDLADVEAELVSVRLGQPNYRGQFVVRTDSGINTLADLAGKNFAFSNNSSNSSYLFPIVHIKKTTGIDYDLFFNDYLFTGGHTAVVDAVYNGTFGGTPIHGGASYEDARTASSIPGIFPETKIIDYTDWIPNDNFSARAGLDASYQEIVVNGVLGAADRPEWDDIMSRLYAWEDVQPVDDSAYDPVRDARDYAGLVLDNCSESGDVTESSGGTLIYIDDNELLTSIEVPAGVVSGTVRLSLSPLPFVTNLPDGYGSITHAFDLMGIYSDTSQVIGSLAQSYTMTVNYYPSQASGLDEDSLALYWWNGTSWQREPTSHVDTSADTVSATPDHFSLFAVLGSNKTYLPQVTK